VWFLRTPPRLAFCRLSRHEALVFGLDAPSKSKVIPAVVVDQRVWKNPKNRIDSKLRFGHE